MYWAPERQWRIRQAFPSEAGQLEHSEKEQAEQKQGQLHRGTHRELPESGSLCIGVLAVY